jgi:hypothetical protein
VGGEVALEVLNGLCRSWIGIEETFDARPSPRRRRHVALATHELVVFEATVIAAGGRGDMGAEVVDEASVAVTARASSVVTDGEVEVVGLGASAVGIMAVGADDERLAVSVLG